MYFTDDGRSECGYVGLTNLGATCYMATCVQQLYMIPDLRDGILTSSVGDGGKHPMTLQELQRMFAYLRDSERKAYNPLSFCKTYEMDHQPLNTGEQKDMAEFFIGKTKMLLTARCNLLQILQVLVVGIISASSSLSLIN